MQDCRQVVCSGMCKTAVKLSVLLKRDLSGMQPMTLGKMELLWYQQNGGNGLGKKPVMMKKQIQ